MPTDSTAFWIGVFIGGFFMGAFCGLAPLIAGVTKHRENLGYIGFASCIVSGLLLGIMLAGPVALVFTLIILFKQPDGPGVQ
jgi:LytS/YehU family sensor histidine kinase